MKKRDFCYQFRKEAVEKVEAQLFTDEQMKKREVKRFLEMRGLFRRRKIGYSMALSALNTALRAIK